jgi:hypothetical protein
MNRLFDFTNTVRFESSLPLDVAIRQLAEMTKRPNPAIVIASLIDKPRMVGNVSENSVILFWVVPLFGNPFKPFLYGKFLNVNNKTVLEGVFTMSESTKMIVYAFFAVAALFELLILYAGWTGNSRVTALSLLFIPALVFLMLVMIFTGRWFSRKDVERISSELNSVLKAT